MKLFEFTRIYTGEDGLTHYQDVLMTMKDAGSIGMLSPDIPVSALVMRNNTKDYDYNWHPAPRKQFVVMLDGKIEIEVGDGEVRTFKTGDVVLLEDTEGKGHKTRNVSGKERRSLFIAVDGPVPYIANDND